MPPPWITPAAVILAVLAFKLFGFVPVASFLAGVVFMEGSFRLSKGYWRD